MSAKSASMEVHSLTTWIYHKRGVIGTHRNLENYPHFIVFGLSGERYTKWYSSIFNWYNFISASVSLVTMAIRAIMGTLLMDLWMGRSKVFAILVRPVLTTHGYKHMCVITRVYGTVLHVKGETNGNIGKAQVALKLEWGDFHHLHISTCHPYIIQRYHWFVHHSRASSPGQEVHSNSTCATLYTESGYIFKKIHSKLSIYLCLICAYHDNYSVHLWPWWRMTLLLLLLTHSCLRRPDLQQGKADGFSY